MTRKINTPTPGSWRVVQPDQPYPYGLEPNWIEVWTTSTEDLAMVTGGTLAHAKMNARLIAAAPDLLAALEAVDEWSFNTQNGEVRFVAPCWDAVKDAITKAKGGE